MNGTTKPDRMIVCVIGNARSGKTTLVQSLRGIEWKEGKEERTAGVDITVADVESAGELVFCDFAGQPLFHKTHGLFFSGSSRSFLLVADLSKTKEELKTESEYWMSFLKCGVCLPGQAYVVVIGSKKDELSPVALQRAKKTIKNLVETLQILFGEWFEIYDNPFVLNCRECSSSEASELRKTLGDIKQRALEVCMRTGCLLRKIVVRRMMNNPFFLEFH